MCPAGADSSVHTFLGDQHFARDSEAVLALDGRRDVTRLLAVQ